MGYRKRTYTIEEVMSGNPPKPQPVLSDNGHVIDPSTPIIFNKNTDRMKKVDHYRIRFDIRNFGNSRLRFVPVQNDAMWADKGTSCPTAPCALPGVFWTDEMDPDGEWIDVINMDMTTETFRFTLNFVDKSVSNPTPADYVPLDPIGGNENSGGSGSGFSFSAFAAIGLGLTAGLAAFFGARLLFAW